MLLKFQKSKYICQIFIEKEFRQKSLISKAVDGIICGFGVESYIYAIDAMSKIIKMELDNKLIKKLLEVLEELKKSTKGQENLVEELKDS